MFDFFLQPLIEASLCVSCDQIQAGAQARFCLGCGRHGNGWTAIWCASCRQTLQKEAPSIRFCARCGKRHAEPLTLKQLSGSPEGGLMKTRLTQTIVRIQLLAAVVAAVMAAVVLFMRR